ncbi:MAG: hypothetical protein Q9184_007997 [Pyrenodesmia sp. 2 TL-2023]
MTSISSPTDIDMIVHTIETLTNLLSALSPEESAAHQHIITHRASHLASQLAVIANSSGDQSGPIKASSGESPTLTKQSSQSPIHQQPKIEPLSNSQLKGNMAPVSANPLKRLFGPPPLPPQTQQKRASPTSEEPSSSPSTTPATSSTSNSLASLFAERASRLESQQRQRKVEEQQEARAKAKARQEAVAADPTKLEQRKHAEEMRKRMDREKAQKELLRKRIEEDRKERKERSEQQRLRREALAVDGAVPAAKRVQIVGGEIKVVEGKGKGAVAVKRFEEHDGGDEDYQEEDEDDEMGE